MEKRDSHSDFDDVVRLLGRAAQHSDSPGQAQPLATPTTPEATPLPGVLARADRAPFVGREALLRELDERWAAAARGGRLVVLTGEPGIGKTRLAARFAAATGAAVLYGRADEESVSPFQPFVEALRYHAARHPGVADEAGLTPAAAEELARLVPELGPSAAAPVVPHPEERDRERHHLFDGAVRLLLHAAGQRRLLLVIDDLQWADVPTLLLLRQLLRRGAGVPLLTLATYSELEARGTDLPRLLADMRREAPVDIIPVAGLDAAESAALVAAHGGRGPDDGAAAQRLRDQTGGNPFFIAELLHDRGAAAFEPVEGVPQGVKDLIGRRLARLSPEALDTLTLAAVLGCDFDLSTLQVVADDHDPDDVIAALEAAVGAGLVVEDAEEVDRFSFAHVLMRETLYERPIASRRLRLHRHIAEALEEKPGAPNPAEIAHHYFQARAVGGAAKALVFNLRAGEAAQAAHAYEDAAVNYERALIGLEQVRGDDPAARCDVLLALGSARWQASEPDARSTFLQALELARAVGSPDRFARAALGAGGRFYAPGATDYAYAALLEEALAGLEPGDSALRVRLLARLAENLVFAEPERRAAELAGEAVGMARRHRRAAGARRRARGTPRRAAARRARARAPARRRGDARAGRRAQRLGTGRAGAALAPVRPDRAGRARRGHAPARGARAAGRRSPTAALPSFRAHVARRVERARGALR